MSLLSRVFHLLLVNSHSNSIMPPRHSSPLIPETTSFDICLVVRNISLNQPGPPQLEYAKWTVYYYCFWIILFTIAQLSRLVISKFFGSKSLLNIRCHFLIHKSTAIWRFVAYRRIPGSLAEALGLPSLAVMTLLFLSSVFISIMTFAQTPYLLNPYVAGSPPLSLRCAMTISALNPLILALCSKINLISILTSISYEKLNIFHRFTGYVLLALATVHMVRYII